MKKGYGYKYYAEEEGRKKRKRMAAISGLLFIFQMSFGTLALTAVPSEAVKADTISLCPLPADVIMIIDRSGSMSDGSCRWYDRTTENYVVDENKTEVWCDQQYKSDWTAYDPTKMQAAKAAADSFLNKMGSDDQSALVSFASNFTLNKQLSSGHAETKTAVDGLTAGGATDIGDGIALGIQELRSARANPQAAKIMILLTDGRANKPNGDGTGENPADVAYAITKAGEAAAYGYKIYTIGLGGDSDYNGAMLQTIADDTGGEYYQAPTAGNLESIYDTIASRVCALGSITGCKYSDTDNDGDIADETVKLSGWEIKLNNSDSRVQYTGDDGCYAFSGLEPGTYTVSEGGRGSDPYVQTYPAEKSWTVELGTEENKANIDFGNYLPVCGNGIADSGEACDDGARNGACPARCDSSCSRNECGEMPTGTISGYKYEDADGATTTPDWTPLAGWKIELYDPATTSLITSTTTDTDGFYEFSLLPFGSYSIREESRAHWREIFNTSAIAVIIDINNATSTNNNFYNYEEPYCGDGTVDRAAGEACDNGAQNGACPASCDSSCKLNECGGGETPTGTISGYKYKDADGATTTPDWTALAGWKIELYDQATTSLVTSTTTGADGFYEFKQLPYGSYIIQEESRAHWAEIFNKTSIAVVLDANNATSGNNNFYNYAEPYCGDGTINQTSEKCDDGNNNNGDGCSSICQTESSGGGSNGGGGGGGTPLCILTGTCGQGSGYLTPTPGSSATATETPVVLGEEGAPKLEITKKVSKEFANPGDTGIEYTITVKNAGNLTAFEVEATDVMPEGLAHADNKALTLNWKLGDIEPGASKEIKFKVDIDKDAEAGVYTNTAKAKATNYGEVKATAKLEIRPIAVLAATGFSYTEFALLLALLTLLIAIPSNYYRKLKKGCRAI